MPDAVNQATPSPLSFCLKLLSGVSFNWWWLLKAICDWIVNLMWGLKVWPQFGEVGFQSLYPRWTNAEEFSCNLLEALELEFLKLCVTCVPFWGQCLSSWEALRLPGSLRVSPNWPLPLAYLDRPGVTQPGSALAFLDQECEEVGKGAQGQAL